MATTDNQVDARRGTVVWGIRAFSRDALTALLNDLVDHQSGGIDKDSCTKVLNTLEYVTNTATSVSTPFPMNWWQKALWKDFDDLHDAYESWNNCEGTDPTVVESRIAALRRLRNRRETIASKIRRNGSIIDQELDLILVRNLYSAFGDLAQAMPDIMKNVSAAVARFAERSA